MKNFHTHTYRCGHATGTVTDYVLAAIDSSLTHLGFSDHVPLPDDRWNIRMPYGELSDYVEELEKADEEYGEIQIYKGAECEYFPGYVNYYQDELLGYYRMDYLIGAVHFLSLNGDWVNCYHAESSKPSLFAYTEDILKVIDCDLFDFVAHPDVFGAFYHKWDEEALACSKAILEAASSKKRTLEINSSGFRKEFIRTPDGSRQPYPLYEFWSLASDYDISVIVNSDAHRPEDVADFGVAYQMVEELNLTVADLNHPDFSGDTIT